MINYSQFLRSCFQDSTDYTISHPFKDGLEYLNMETKIPLSYENLEREIAKGRGVNRNKKRVLSSVFTLHRITDKGFSLELHGCPFLEIYSNNVCRVTATNSDLSYHAQSFVSTAGYMFGIDVHRQKTGLYRIGMDYGFMNYIKSTVNALPYEKRKEFYEQLKNYDWWTAISKMVRNYFPVFKKDLEFDLTTGECLNRDNSLEPKRPTEDKEKRKVWRKQISKYKKALKVSLKLGMFEQIYNKFIQNVHGMTQSNMQNLALDWHSDENIKLLADNIYSERVSPELQSAIAYTIVCHAKTSTYDYHQLRDIEQAKIMETKFDLFFAELSKPLRLSLGVMTDEGTHQTSTSNFSRQSWKVNVNDEIHKVTPTFIHDIISGKYKSCKMEVNYD